MPRQLALFLVAVQFLTRIPVPAIPGFQPDWTGRSARYFPLVGGLVGCLCAGVFLAASTIWTGSLPALLAIAAGTLITGTFHEDGLADSLDGLGGGQTRARRLEIMKDSRIGTFGTFGLGLTLAVKIVALSELSSLAGAMALVAAHAAGRAAAVVAMRALPYAGDLAETKVKPVAAGVTLGEVLTAVLIGAVTLTPLLLTTPLPAIAALAGAAVFAAAMVWAAARLIGGWTGDTLGATEQMFEVGFLLVISGMLAAR